jgi:hypothetical protein
MPGRESHRVRGSFLLLSIALPGRAKRTARFSRPEYYPSNAACGIGPECSRFGPPSAWRLPRKPDQFLALDAQVDILIDAALGRDYDQEESLAANDKKKPEPGRSGSKATIPPIGKAASLNRPLP